MSSIPNIPNIPNPQNSPKNAQASPQPRRHRHIVPIRRLNSVGRAAIRHHTGPEVRRLREGQRGAAGAVECGARPRGGDGGDGGRGGGGAGDWT